MHCRRPETIRHSNTILDIQPLKRRMSCFAPGTQGLKLLTYCQEN